MIAGVKQKARLIVIYAKGKSDYYSPMASSARGFPTLPCG